MEQQNPEIIQQNQEMSQQNPEIIQQNQEMGPQNQEMGPQNPEMGQQQNGNYFLMIGIKLSPEQVKSIETHRLDFNKITNLQKPGQWPDISNSSSFKVGKNFDNAVLVGYRKDIPTMDPVYLKVDGWFTTPTDITNCNPELDSTGNPIFTEQGYSFMDVSRVAASGVAMATSNALKTGSNYFSNIASYSPQGGKTRKRTKRTKRRSKSKRRYKK